MEVKAAREAARNRPMATNAKAPEDRCAPGKNSIDHQSEDCAIAALDMNMGASRTLRMFQNRARRRRDGFRQHDHDQQTSMRGLRLGMSLIVSYPTPNNPGYEVSNDSQALMHRLRATKARRSQIFSN